MATDKAGPPPRPSSKLGALRKAVDVPTVAAAGLTIICWAANFPSIRFAVQEYDPPQVALLRFLLASAVLGVYAAVLRMPLPALKDVWAFAFFGLTGMTLSTLVLTYGLTTVSAGSGSFLVGTIPIFSTMLARAFLKERLGPVGWLGIAVSFSGMGLIALGEGEGLRFNPGTALIVLSAFFQSIFYVFQKPYHLRYSPLQITTYTIWSATAWLLVFLPGLPGAIRAAPLAHTLAVVFLGLFPTGLAFFMWAYALSRAKAAKVTSAMFLMPPIALAMAWVWLGEVPTLFSLAGGLLALAGVMLLNLWGR